MWQRAEGVRNVIYLLGDGMGRSQITAARDRFYGAGGRLNMEHLGAVSTYSVEADSERPVRM
ncbi:alkaline phosphatase [Nocardia panacis]|nr:alkaline phosphatase [Nocardia panacis]